jgi:hypothetical protein
MSTLAPDELQQQGSWLRPIQPHLQLAESRTQWTGFLSASC